MLDFESTGIDTREARIVTGYFGTVLGRDGRRRPAVAPTSLLVNPGVPIPVGATEVHGVTNEMAQEKGVEPVHAVNTYAEEVARSLIARIPVVGFNLAYDLSLLYWECLRWDLPTVAERMGLPPDRAFGPIIDAHVLDKQVDQYRKGKRQLTPTAEHYGVALANAHTADADAMASVRVAVRIAEKYPDEIPTDAVVLHRLQKLWRADQAASLQRYFRTKGRKPEAYVDPCWPLCTDPTHPSG
jgi:DNA polymerase-3 subunit epsilon